MDSPVRRRPFVFAAPMLVGIIALSTAAARVRAVDIVLLFAGGAAFGIGVMQMAGFLRARRS